MKKILLSSLLVFSSITSIFAAGHVATAVGTSPTCNGLCNGSAVAMASGGIGPYGFTWTGPASYTATGANISGLCAGTYIVTAIDSSDMSTALYTLNLTQPSLLSVTANSPTVCAGVSAALNANPTGGTPTYSYSWSPAGSLSSSTISNPMATPPTSTAYTVTVMDANGCTGTAISTVTVNPNPVVTVNSPTICPGVTAVLTAGGATTYAWTPGATVTGPNTATVAPPGTTSYTVTGTTAGCTAFAVSTVTVNPNPVVTANSGSTCAGNPFTVFASGAMTYLWSTGATANPMVVNPATTTSYTVTGSSLGCTGTAVATVTVNPLPTVISEPNINVCAGTVLSPNTFSSSPAGSTFTWTNSNTAIGLAASGAGSLPAFTATNGSGSPITATITVTATRLGCTGPSMTFTITVNPAVIVTVGSIVPASCGVCNGSVTATGSGSAPPYSYNWSPGFMTTPTASGLCNGTYTVTLTDSNGCYATATAVVPNISGLTSTTSTTPTGCTLCNGSANVTPTGGTGPYTYDWTPGTPAGDGTPSLSALCAGSYTVTVTDASGCTSTSVANVVLSSPVIATASSTSDVCGAGCNGTVTVMESGGTPPYLYDLTGYPQQTNGNFSGICAGTLVATVTDANGCTGTYSIIVNSVSSGSLSATGTVTNETGFGLTNGSIDLSVSGSAPPFTFLWNNGATTEDIFSLAGGVYSVTITDNNGDCASYTFTVNTTPGYGYITGYLYSDINLNCVYDAGDSALSGYYVKASNGSLNYWGYTNASGYYSIYAPSANYTVTPLNTTYLEVGCPASYSITLTTGMIFSGNNFAYSIPVIYDVCVTAYCNGIVPGFNGNYYVQLKNWGTVTAVGVAYIVLPSALSYVSSSPAASSISGDTIFWNYTIAPYVTQWYWVTFYTPPSTLLGTTMVAYVNATVTNGTDINPACNSYTYSRVVTGSFDPNDKTASPAGIGSSGNIPLTETEFSYLIRFQNTGTGPAVNINVYDTISSMLDLMSFQMLNSSDDYVVEFLPGNVVRWRFDNIMLPDSTSDEPGSHGHIQFKISKLTAPSYGEVIENKAAIYFDFNEPVITNIAVNTYSMMTAIEVQANESGSVKIYPNPFTDNTTFIIQSDNVNEIYSFELTDVLGKKVKSKAGISEKQFEISRDGLENGIYFYKIYTSESVIGIGKVVIK